MVHASTSNEELFVQNFILPGRRWDQVGLSEWLRAESVYSICKIPIPQNSMRDRLGFLGSDLEKYSVNKAYKNLTSARFDDGNE